MKPLYKLTNMKSLLAGFIALSAMASCSSYQYSGYDSDGIYGSQEQPAQERPTYTQDNYTESSSEALQYKRLFAQQSAQLGEMAESGMIFTDVDSYSSTGNYDQETYGQDGIRYTGGQPGWGDHADEISINIYSDPFFDPFYGPTFAGFYGYGFYGTPWHRPGLSRWGYSPWGPGFVFNNPYGPGFYTPWRWDPFWGNSWNAWRYTYHHNPYWIGGWYDDFYYNRRNVSYNNGRRNAYTYDAVDTRSNVNAARSSRISDYSNSRSIRANRNNSSVRSNSSTDQRTYSTRTTRVESPQSRARRAAIYRSSADDSYDYNTRARAARETRSNTYSNSVRRSVNTSNSGAIRSSSSSRSSGTSSGSSRGSRGRGN